MVRELEHLPCEKKLRELALVSGGRRVGFRGTEEQPAGTYGEVMRKTDAGC